MDSGTLAPVQILTPTEISVETSDDMFDTYCDVHAVGQQIQQMKDVA
jgi:hypothetical protein